MAIYRGTGGPGDSTTDTTVTTVTQKATEAAASATAAASSATSASSSATSASTSATNAATSETNAATSATSAASSATSASTSATTASSAATSASTAQTAAETAQTAAEAAKTAAETAETNAASSASSASSSATSASTSATNAATSATNAATSASSASSSATSAASAQTAAESARDAAVAAQEAIDGLYLGAQTSDPSVDLNGDPVTAGDWYYNTATDVTRIYDGTQWVNGAVNTSSFLLQGNNLSDLDNATTARTNLGLVIGTDVQAYSAVLAATTASFTTADETKLDGIEAGATADQTASEILTAIKTVDGTGSGLDADLLDGNEASAFATSAQGALADSAVQPGDNVSDLTNDAGYLTSLALNGISDVTITTVADNEVLAYDSTSSAWINQTAAEAGLATTTDIANASNWDTAYGWGDHSTAGYLTSYTETDPVVGAINGIVKANGAGTISAAVAGTDYLTTNQTITLSGDITGSGTTAITTSLASNSVGITELDVTDGTSGQVLSTNGAGVLSFVDQSGGGGSVSLLNTQTFTSSGTWTKPASGSFAVVYTWGGGGAGGAGGAGDPGGGGGGGCFIARRFDLTDLGSTETVTIGAGGVGALSTGANGGTTTFGSHITAYGGSGGGQTTTNATGGQGGGYNGTGAVQTSSAVPNEVDNSMTSAQASAIGVDAVIGTRNATYGGVGGEGGRTASDERSHGDSKEGTLALFDRNGTLIFICEAGAGGGGTNSSATEGSGIGGSTLIAGAGGSGAGADASPGPSDAGASLLGGDGGLGGYDSVSGADGSSPAGGGGGSENVAGGSGGDGKCIVYVYG